MRQEGLPCPWRLWACARPAAGTDARLAAAGLRAGRQALWLWALWGMPGMPPVGRRAQSAPPGAWACPGWAGPSRGAARLPPCWSRCRPVRKLPMPKGRQISLQAGVQARMRCLAPGGMPLSPVRCHACRHYGQQALRARHASRAVPACGGMRAWRPATGHACAMQGRLLADQDAQAWRAAAPCTGPGQRPSGKPGAHACGWPCHRRAGVGYAQAPPWGIDIQRCAR